MADWLSSMQQTYEYYIVDPATWKDTKKLENVKSTSISRDSDTETLGSASLDLTESVGECYIRIYLVTIQNGVTEKHPLATVLVQTPSFSFDGKVRNITVDAYTPLLELKEKMPPLGYSLLKDTNIMSEAYRIVRENARAPVVEAKCDENIYYDFISDPSDTWLTFTRDFIANAKYVFDLDEMGRILFAPKQDTASLQPVWTYDDGNSSILYSDISLDRDLYGIPNVVEVTYSNGNEVYRGRAVNDDSNSPTSTVNRGREIIYRESNPDMIGNPTGDHQLDRYAEQLLRDLSSIECTITYTHGYCPVRVGDCVRLDYGRAGLTDIKAKVIRQNIKCEPGCPVSETAVFTNKFWG